MTKKINVGSDPDEDNVPDWVKDDSPSRSTPYEMVRLTRVRCADNPYPFVDLRIFQRG